MTSTRDGAKGSVEGPKVFERLSGIDDFEMYRLFDARAMETLATVALRPDDGRRAEYVLWYKDAVSPDDDEPDDSGTVEWTTRVYDWGHVAREDVLRKLALRYVDDLGVRQDELAFRFAGPPDGVIDDEEEDEGYEEEPDEDEEDEEDEDDG